MMITSRSRIVIVYNTSTTKSIIISYTIAYYILVFLVCLYNSLGTNTSLSASQVSVNWLWTITCYWIWLDWHHHDLFAYLRKATSAASLHSMHPLPKQWRTSQCSGSMMIWWAGLPGGSFINKADELEQEYVEECEKGRRQARLAITEMAADCILGSGVVNGV
jgi:hypothetical protein